MKKECFTTHSEGKVALIGTNFVAKTSVPPRWNFTSNIENQPFNHVSINFDASLVAYYTGVLSYLYSSSIFKWSQKSQKYSNIFCVQMHKDAFEYVTIFLSLFKQNAFYQKDSFYRITIMLVVIIRININNSQ